MSHTLKKKQTCVIKKTKKKDLPVKYSIFASFLEIQNYAFFHQKKKKKNMPLKTSHAPNSHRLKGFFFI